MMIQRLFVGEIPREIAGPVGIYALASQAAQFGILTLINFIGILSVNLVILNLLPFPAIDGGRLMFILIEALIGRKLFPKVFWKKLFRKCTTMIVWTFLISTENRILPILLL